MKLKTSPINLSKISEVNERYEQREAERRRMANEKFERNQRRFDAGSALVILIIRLEESAGLCRDMGQPFDSKPFEKPLLDAFFHVCAVMREFNLYAELEALHEEKMVAHYGKERDVELAIEGYRTAIALLKTGAVKRTKALEAALAPTLGTIGGRHIWYMMLPIIEGLVRQRVAVFKLSTAEIPADLKHITQFKGANGPRNWQWWTWANSEMKPSEIRDLWNKENPTQKIKPKEQGRQVVKKALDAIKKSISPQV